MDLGNQCVGLNAGAGRAKGGVSGATGNERNQGTPTHSLR